MSETTRWSGSRPTARWAACRAVEPLRLALAIMSILDVTVVNVAINTLAKEFDTTLSTIQWVVTGYTLALATVIPLTGWAADRFGTKRLYMISIALSCWGLRCRASPGRPSR